MITRNLMLSPDCSDVWDLEGVISYLPSMDLSLVSHDIVLMRTDVIKLLNRVPEHDSLFSCSTERNVNEWERF